MGYMYAPLELTERQLLIYFYLYKKCDFKNMQVECTTSQIITGIKIIDLTSRIVNAELKSMEQKGFLKNIKKGTKGNCSVYEIVKINEMQVTNAYLMSNLKPSNSNGSDDEQVTNAYLIGKPITKNKEKDNNKKEKLTSFDKIINAYTDNKDLVEAIKDFIKMRKTIKKPLTDRSLKGVLNKLNKFTDKDNEKIEILDNSIQNCWLSVYELKNKKAPGAAGGEKKNSYDKSISNNGPNYSQKIEGSKFI